MVGQHNFVHICQTGVVINRRVQVKENWQVYLLIRVQKLVFKAETLDFVKVERALFGRYLVNRDASDRLVRLVIDLVESKGRLTCIDCQLGRFGLEVPRDLVLRVAHKLYLVLAENVHLIVFKRVVLVRSGHRKTKCLADHIIERHGQKVPTKQQETKAVNSVEFAPLRFGLEDFVYSHCLSAFSHRERQGLLFFLEL